MGERCSATVYTPGRWTSPSCLRIGVVFENENWWCKQHSPIAIKKRHDERDKLWARERAKRDEEIAQGESDRLAGRACSGLTLPESVEEGAVTEAITALEMLLWSVSRSSSECRQRWPALGGTAVKRTLAVKEKTRAALKNLGIET